MSGLKTARINLSALLMLFFLSPGMLIADEKKSVLVGLEREVALRQAEVEQLFDMRAKLFLDIESLESNLDTLSKEIAELKLRRFRGPRAEVQLNRKLQESRDLSLQLDELVRVAKSTKEDMKRSAMALVRSYDLYISKLQAELKVLSRDAKDGLEQATAAVMKRIQALDRDRQMVLTGLSMLDGDRDPIIDEGVRGLLSARPISQDPDELRAKADILRDTRDRLERQLKELDRHVKRAQRQKSLERDLADFMSEGRFFDDGGRSAARLVSSRTSSGDQDADPVAGIPESGQERADDSFDDSDGFDGGDGTGPPLYDDGGSDGSRDVDHGHDGVVSDPVQDPTPIGGIEQSTPMIDIGFVSDSRDWNGLDSGLYSRVTTREEAGAALDSLLDYEGGNSLNDIEEHLEDIKQLMRRLDRQAQLLERRANSIDDRFKEPK